MRVLFLPGMALAMALIQPPAAPVFAQPADHIAASGDSLAGVDAPALSSEESEWIDAILLAPGQASDKAVTIREIRISGLDSGAFDFLRAMLPFKVGDSFPESRLDTLLAGHNQLMSGRTDLWESYAARLTGFGEGDSRILRIDVRPYTAGTYYGGGAFAYLGNHNRTGKGDIWGLWLGYNLNGAEWDAYVADGWYLGGRATFSFPLDPVLPGQDRRDLTGALRARKILAIPAELHLEAGLTATFLDPIAPDARDRELSPFVRPALQLRFPPSRGRESTFLLELDTRLGRNLDAGRTFLGSSARCDWRHPLWRSLSMAWFGRLEKAWLETEYPAGLSEAFALERVLSGDSLPDLAATLEAQTRLRLLRKQLGFTRLDAGPFGFGETLFAAGEGSHAGFVGGAGAFLAFTAPVGVDFAFAAGFSRHGREGYRLATHVYF